MKETSPNYDENYNNVPLPLDRGGLGWGRPFDMLRVTW